MGRPFLVAGTPGGGAVDARLPVMIIEPYFDGEEQINLADALREKQQAMISWAAEQDYEVVFV